MCSSTRCVVGSFTPDREKKIAQHATGGQDEGPGLTGLSERGLRQQLKKSAKPMGFDGGSGGEGAGY